MTPELESRGISYERRGDGAPLVLVHGIGSRWQIWRPVLDALSAHHDVIALDVPGFGTSPHPGTGTPAGVPSLCALLEGFFAELGIERPHVAGNSMGGWIALELARRGSVASSTALSPGGFYGVADVSLAVSQLSVMRLAARLGRGLAPILCSRALGRRLAFSNVVAHPERLTAEDGVLALQGVADAAWFWPTLAELATHRCEDGAEVRVPVTIAWGTEDRLLPPRQAATALARFPTASFASLPGCGHIPTFDNPALVGEVILRTTRTPVSAER